MEETVIKNIFITAIVAILFTACSSNNIQKTEKTSTIEDSFINEYNNLKTSYSSKIKSKWIQADNKDIACKVYVEFEDTNDRTKSSNFKIFWDGECENGYAKGLGKEFEKGVLLDNNSIAVYENPPFSKPKYYTQNFQLKNIEVKGDLNSGYNVYKINDEKYRYGYFSKDYNPSLINYEIDDKTTIYKKIYPNFNYEILYNKEDKTYNFYLNSEDKRYALNDLEKRNSIIKEVLEAKETALENEKKANLIEKQYKKKICKDYISVNFLDDNEYKDICFEKNSTYAKTKIYNSTKENYEDELEYLLQSSKTAKRNENAYAIILGIEDYLLESNVNFSHNSAKMFVKYSQKILGVPEDNIWAFVEDRKTSAGFIKSQWNQFLSSIPKDATIYFYYSGHGVPGIDGNPYILPSDTNAETVVLDKYFMLNNIYKDLTDTKASKIIAFVDSCFSGKDDNGNLLFGGVAPVLKTNPINFDKNKMTLFTAGGANEFSNQYKEKHHRLFSYYLMKGLAKGYVSSNDLYQYLKKNVADKSRKMGFAYKQIPQLSGLVNSEIK